MSKIDQAADQALRTYLDSLSKNLAQGDATEHTHRPALKSVLEILNPGTRATNEPRRVKCGAPDFSVRNSQALVIGYVETKDVGASLDAASQTEQLVKYRAALPNLILTNYLEFRWFVDGELRTVVRLASILKKGKMGTTAESLAKVRELFSSFARFSPEQIKDADQLATRMARIARIIRDTVEQALLQGEASQTLKDLRSVVARILISDIAEEEKIGQFADMYAQTLVYGYFIARCNHKGPANFERKGAASEIALTNPFLQSLMEVMTGGSIEEEPYVDYVDDLVTLLAASDMAGILAGFKAQGETQDPVIHFYETFLKAYDSEIRETRGVYYTPFPVVKFIVDSIHAMLQTRFGLPRGLGDNSEITFNVQEFIDAEGNAYPHGPKEIRSTSPRVLILDPACGTGTFLYAVIRRLREHYRARGEAGLWTSFVRQQLLRRLFGFELLMAPYAVAHLKLSMQLAALDMEESERPVWEYRLQPGERLGVYLTNTLEEPEKVFATLYGQLRAITDEASAASRIKRDLPIMVVLGNPPYQGNSFNKGAYAKQLVSAYQQVDGKPLKEIQQKWLHDDYVKFIRWGESRIERTGSGILGFITNHKYLENVTFSGMRQHLLNTFDEIYVLDLHGNSKAREVPPGKVDRNVFDIQQGVAIGVFVKRDTKAPHCKVFHADLWGTRDDKYEFLNTNSIQTVAWTDVAPTSPNYLFKPRDASLTANFDMGWNLAEAMPEHTVGIVAARDRLCFRFTKTEMARVIKDVAILSEAEVRDKYDLKKDARDWKVRLAQEDVKKSGGRQEYIIRALYRPFDERFTYYTGQSKGFLGQPQSRVMTHLIGHPDNVAIGTTRSFEIGRGWEHAFVTSTPAQHHAVSNKEADYFFPLYLYDAAVPGAGAKAKSAQRQNKLPGSNPWATQGKHPNFTPGFVVDFEKKLQLKFLPIGKGDLQGTFGAEDLFGFVYAILHCRSYRKKFEVPLRNSFPRIPVCSDRKQFQALATRGSLLLSLHLLKSAELNDPPVTFPVPGKCDVDSKLVRFEAAHGAAHGNVYLNSDQYFGRVAAIAWQTHIGGYQVMAKWLEDRAGRRLEHEDLTRYQRMAYALELSDRTMDEIDVLAAHPSFW